MKNQSQNKNSGFTILELVVSIGIFALMTSLLLAKYGNFNQGVLLTNLAYDVALSIRNAQSYGLNVKSASRTADAFLFPYGVHFEANVNNFVFFVDVDKNAIYSEADDDEITTTLIKRGSKISYLCSGESSNDCPSTTFLDITFKRPDPNAIIMRNNGLSTYAEIIVMATDGSTKKIMVRSNGQIAVQ